MSEETKIKQAIASRQAIINKLVARNKRDKKKIADAVRVKPLRHGDYGLDSYNRPCIELQLQDGMGTELHRSRAGSTYAYTNEWPKTSRVFKVLTVMGNIFDDIITKQTESVQCKK